MSEFCVTSKDIRKFLENYCKLDQKLSMDVVGNLIQNSPIVTNVSNVSGLSPYMEVSGDGVDIDTVIDSIDSPTQITLSKPALSSGEEKELVIEDYTFLSNEWIEKRFHGFIVPFVEKTVRQSLGRETTAVEYYDGNGKNYLILNRRPLKELLEIRYVLGGSNFTILNLQNIEVIRSQGILKAKRNYEEAYYLPVFAKGDRNLKITYSYGYLECPEDIKECLIYLASEQALGFIGSRQGGGSVSVQGYGRNYGARGMYQDIRNDLARQAHWILRSYGTSVVA